MGFDYAFNGKDFLKSGINFSSFDKVFFKEISEDNGETSQRDPADLVKLIDSFKSQIGFNVSLDSKAINNGTEEFRNKSINAATK
jgi:Xaa-Pro aminopeptidase